MGLLFSGWCNVCGGLISVDTAFLSGPDATFYHAHCLLQHYVVELHDIPVTVSYKFTIVVVSL